MPHFTRSVTRWLLAVVAACLVLAWPLHEAQHASEPLHDQALVQLDLAAAAADAPADDDDAKAVSCFWCLFHVDQTALPGSPPALRWHAEASPPPAASADGQPTGHSPLAAQPRGPPQA